MTRARSNSSARTPCVTVGSLVVEFLRTSNLTRFLPWEQDCPKAHVSKAQKIHPPASVSSGTTAIAPPRPAPPAESPAAGALAGAGEKPCKFGGGCTRQGCVFVHPWDVRGDPSAQVMCRYGAACTRADCHFKHPAHRPAPYSRNKFSATFAKKSGSPASAAAAGGSGKATEGSIAPKPEESAEHVSERLKRFAGSSNAGETERILPGQTAASNGDAKQNGNGGHDDQQKVEIHLDDEEDKKAEVKA